MNSLFINGYALLIGVGLTSEPRWSLPVTVNDIKALHTILTDGNLCAYPPNEKHIRLLHDSGATRQGVIDGLHWLKSRAEADPESTIFIYYSGHGTLDTFANQYYLILHDTKTSDIPSSALEAGEFTKALREIPAKRLLVIIDSCHAEGMATAKDTPQQPSDLVKSGVPKGIIDALKQGEGRAVFTSSRGRQSSYVRSDKKMSIYTYHLIEALQGKGNRPGDTFVRVSNLMNYLSKAVPESTRQLPGQPQQTPFYDTATEDFPVAMFRGGKGLPPDGWKAVRDESDETIRRVQKVLAEKNSTVRKVRQKAIENVSIHQEISASDNSVIEDVEQYVE